MENVSSKRWAAIGISKKLLMFANVTHAQGCIGSMIAAVWP
jgi:hypothetical protein